LKPLVASSELTSTIGCAIVVWNLKFSGAVVMVKTTAVSWSWYQISRSSVEPDRQEECVIIENKDNKRERAMIPIGYADIGVDVRSSCQAFGYPPSADVPLAAY